MLVREVIIQSCNHQLRMHSSNIWSTMNNIQNESFVGELSFESNSMTKVNLTSEKLLFFKIPTIFLVIIINSTSVIWFQSLETNFVYKMIIYDSINNMLYAISLFYGSSFKHPFSFPPFCGVGVALSYGFSTFNRLVPLVIVLYR